LHLNTSKNNQFFALCPNTYIVAKELNDKEEKPEHLKALDQHLKESEYKINLMHEREEILRLLYSRYGITPSIDDAEEKGG
jgi:hypothetical protein